MKRRITEHPQDEEVGVEGDDYEEEFVAGGSSVGKQSGDYMVAIVWVGVIGYMVWYIMLGGE